MFPVPPEPLDPPDPPDPPEPPEPPDPAEPPLLFAAEFAALHAAKKRADENRQSRRRAFQGEGGSISRL